MRPGDEACRIAESLAGTPFKRLSGNLPDHKILGRSSDGQRITVAVVEMVMNDAWMIDSCHGAGTYESSNSGNDPVSVRTREAFELAVKLYGCQPLDLHERTDTE